LVRVVERVQQKGFTKKGRSPKRGKEHSTRKGVFIREVLCNHLTLSSCRPVVKGSPSRKRKEERREEGFGEGGMLVR